MPTKRKIGEGECMSSIAAAARFRTHKTVYDDAANSALKGKRPDPSQLHPGDPVVVPDFETKSDEAPTGKRTRFRVDSERTFLKLRLRYRKKLAYRLTTDSGKKEGETDGSDLVEIEVPRDAKKAKLILWVAGQPLHPDDDGPRLEYDVDLGYLAPIDTLRGVQGRLLNLGYAPGKLVSDENAQPDATTTAAISAFQQAEGKTPTGKPEDVRADLAKAHDA
jgi:hypothetical protein